MRVLASLNCVQGADESNKDITGQLNGRAVSHVKPDGRSAFKGEQGLRTGLGYLGEFSVLKGCDPHTVRQELLKNGGLALNNSITALCLIRDVRIAPWSEAAKNLLREKVGDYALEKWKINGEARKNYRHPTEVDSLAERSRADQFSILASKALKLRERALYQLGGRLEQISQEQAAERSLAHGKVQGMLQSIDTASHALQHCEDVTLSEQTINTLHRLICEREPLDPETAGLLQTQGDLKKVGRMVDAIQTGLSPEQLTKSLPVLADVRALDAASRALQNDPSVTLDTNDLRSLHDRIVEQEVSNAELCRVIKTKGDLDLVRALSETLNAEVGSLKVMLDSLASPQPNQLRMLEGLRCFTQSALQDWNRETAGSVALNGDLSARQKFVWEQFRPHLPEVNSGSFEAIGKHLMGKFMGRSLAMLDVAVMGADRPSELIVARALLRTWANEYVLGAVRAPSSDALTPLDELVVWRLSK